MRGTRGGKGTGIVLHCSLKISFRTFVAINERICFADLDMGECQFRFVAVYMPNRGKDSVQWCYVLIKDVTFRVSNQKLVQEFDVLESLYL